MKRKRILYAGDSPAGGPANYLLAILNTAGVETVHVPPHLALRSSQVKKSDAFILSDYAYSRISKKAESEMIRRVTEGAGLLMVGGWGSFSGPYGGWKKSLIAHLLPVTCLGHDDRLNIAEGLLMSLEKTHSIFSGLSFKTRPVLCGLNEVIVKDESLVLLSARKILQRKNSLLLDQKKYPLLVIDENPAKRIAALTTDAAPHWCGGFVDWGNRREKLKVNGKISVEVGSDYVRLLSNLVRWLCGL